MMNRGLLVVLTSALLMLCAGLKSSVYAQTEPERSIHFVLPNGFVGAFKLVLDKQAGVEMKLENGRYTLEIPRSGSLKIKSFKPFAELHQTTAAYRSGKMIPYDPSGSLTPKTIAFRDVWMIIGDIDGKGEMVPPVVRTYMIGTKRQADKLKRRLEKQKRAEQIVGRERRGRVS
jgi:hypothetical protein